MSSPYDIEPTYIGVAYCGTPYFFCRADKDYHDIVKKETRFIRRRGGDMILREGIQVHEAMQKMLAHWPKTNPIQSIDKVLFRISPDTLQEA